MGKIWAIGVLLMIAAGGVAVAMSGSKALDFTPGEWLFTIGIGFFFCWIIGGFVVDVWKNDGR